MKRVGSNCVGSVYIAGLRCASETGYATNAPCRIFLFATEISSMRLRRSMVPFIVSRRVSRRTRSSVGISSSHTDTGMIARRLCSWSEETVLACWSMMVLISLRTFCFHSLCRERKRRVQHAGDKCVCDIKKKRSLFAELAYSWLQCWRPRQKWRLGWTAIKNSIDSIEKKEGKKKEKKLTRTVSSVLKPRAKRTSMASELGVEVVRFSTHSWRVL